MNIEALAGKAQPITDPEIDIAEAREELRQDFYETALWRRKLVSRYPEDERNEKAALLLDQLAVSSANVPDDLLARFERTLDSLPTDQELDTALRGIAFRTFPDTAETFIRDFIAKYGPEIK